METKLKPVIELTDLEAEKELTELLGECAHEFDSQHGLGMNCIRCKRSVNQCRPKPYATSYDAILEVVHTLTRDQQSMLNISVYKTPREITDEVITVLEYSE